MLVRLEDIEGRYLLKYPGERHWEGYVLTLKLDCPQHRRCLLGPVMKECQVPEAAGSFWVAVSHVSGEPSPSELWIFLQRLLLDALG